MIIMWVKSYHKVLEFAIYCPPPLCISFPDSLADKESACNAGDPSSSPGLGRSAGEGMGYPLQYSGLENSMDYKINGLAKSQTQLHAFHTPLYWSIILLEAYFSYRFFFGIQVVNAIFLTNLIEAHLHTRQYIYCV